MSKRPRVVTSSMARVLTSDKKQRPRHFLLRTCLGDVGRTGTRSVSDLSTRHLLSFAQQQQRHSCAASSSSLLLSSSSLSSRRRRCCRCFSSTLTTTTPPLLKLNPHDNHHGGGSGVVQGVWIFSRHGDRSPGRCLVPAHRRQQEAAYWVSKLPFPDSTAAYRAYSKHFPLVVEEGRNKDNNNTNQGQFLDTRRNPYGFLSQKGLFQLRASGNWYFERYQQQQHQQHPPPRRISQENATFFLSAWHVKAYSTNYLRTVLSAQSFLDGFLGTCCFTPACERNLDLEFTEERNLPTHAWKDKESNSRTTTSTTLVPVTVRALAHDPLNAFDRNPDLIAELVSQVMTSPSFQRRDAAAAPLAGRLANVLPGLIRPRRSDFSSRSPSGINWVEAADHFVCRESHDLPLAHFTDYDQDDRAEQTLKAMSSQTKSHLAWRFRQWYKNRKLLSAIAGPPLREILDQMHASTKLGDSEKRPFTLYACHDITILGLLYGLGANFLANDKSSDWMYWPPYASTLALELVRTEEQEFRVRALLDGVPVHSVDFYRQGFPSLASTPDGVLDITDFESIVEKLERDGGPAAKL